MGYKTNDYILTVSKTYRLRTYLIETDIGKNIALLAVFTLISLVLIIIILIISFRRKKQAKVTED